MYMSIYSKHRSIIQDMKNDLSSFYTNPREFLQCFQIIRYSSTFLNLPQSSSIFTYFSQLSTIFYQQFSSRPDVFRLASIIIHRRNCLLEGFKSESDHISGSLHLQEQLVRHLIDLFVRRLSTQHHRYHKLKRSRVV